MGRNGQLNARQQKFVEAFLRLGNATHAYKAAGYRGTGNTAESTACQLLKNPKVSQAIREGQAKANRESQVTLAMIVRRLKDIAFANVDTEITLSHVLKASDQLIKCIALEGFEQRLAAIEARLEERNGHGRY
jgi:phage terminase small subunit